MSDRQRSLPYLRLSLFSFLGVLSRFSAPTVGLASEAALQGSDRFCSFSERGPESMVVPREAIYAEAAWIVLCNPIGFYDGVGGAGR
jgi:hypothetical protein